MTHRSEDIALRDIAPRDIAPPDVAPRHAVPQDATASAPLLHPLALVALVLLVVNDHFLKTNHPSWLTGKLSDVAFMILAPLWLGAGGAYLTAPLVRSWRRSEQSVAPQYAPLLLLLAILCVGAFFTSMQLSAWGDLTYRVTLGALQWPARAVAQWIEDESLPALTQVVHTPDPTDLLCLPFLWVAWKLGRPREEVS